MNKFKSAIEITDPAVAANLFWATKILKNEDPTKFDSYAVIKDGTITTTDKFRIHKVSGIPGDIPNGNYVVIVSSPTRVCLGIPPEEVAERIPDFSKLLSVGDGSTNTTFLCSKNKTTLSVEFAKLIRAFPKPTGLSYAFVSDLGFSDEKYAVKWFSPEKPIIFSIDNKIAAIMPISMNE